MAKKKNTTRQDNGQGHPITISNLPVVGLGASAGGLQALKAFFGAVSKDTKLCYLILVHSSPDQPTMLPELLGKVAHIPVVLAEEGMEIEAGHAYVTPSAQLLTLNENKISLSDSRAAPGALPIDAMFSSIAKNLDENAAAVVLSGNRTDGTLGIKAVKHANGLVIVQDEASAEFTGMPHSALGTGLADLVLPPEEMPGKIEAFFDGYETLRVKGDDEANKKALTNIFSILQSRTGHDFSCYKSTSIGRRLTRRMSVNNITELHDYVHYLRQTPDEVNTLFHEMLIGVTQFFRDPEAFDALKRILRREVLPSLSRGDTFRVWVPGCSTGEEVYSLAIILHECLEQMDTNIHLQIFGTDIDERAINQARKGLFPASVSADIGGDRLERFFTREGEFYRIAKEVRDDIVFSLQDVLRDPPFSRLNLLSCRNLLIYLDARIQQKLLPLFHHTLVPGGLMMLGPSESVSRFSDLFNTRVKQWKIFQSLEVEPAKLYPIIFPHRPSHAVAAGEQKEQAGRAVTLGNLANSARQAALDCFSPTTVLVDKEGEIVHIQGRSGKYLEHPSGTPTKNIISLAREGLRIELSSAIRQAATTGKKVKRSKVKVKTNGEYQMIDLHVIPQPSTELHDYLLLGFVETEEVAVESKAHMAATEGESQRIAELEEELLRHREGHQATLEELDTANEELKSTNEEMQSTNEELQSSNEELESSKEELQSLNEELQTVNAELQAKVDELSSSNDDMRNLLNATHIATIFVDNKQRVRRFTEETVTIVNLIATDIGRPLRHVATNLREYDMIDDLTRTIRSLTPITREVQTNDGDWYVMRMVPYLSSDNRIDGAVINFNQINEQKRVQATYHKSKQEAEGALALVRHVFDMNDLPAAVLDRKGNMVIANRIFTSLLGVEPKKVEGAGFLALEHEIFKNIDLKEKLHGALEENRDFTTSAFEIATKNGRKLFNIRGRVIREGEEFPYRILINFKKAEE